MKTFKILFALLPFFLVFSSCSEDDGPEGNNSETSQLLGKWMYEGLTVNGGTFEEEPSDASTIFEFKTGGILLITYEYEDEEDEEESGTYAVNNNSLTIKIDGESFTYNITQLSGTSLRLGAQIDWEDDGVMKNIIFYFTKI